MKAANAYRQKLMYYAERRTHPLQRIRPEDEPDPWAGEPIGWKEAKDIDG